MSDFSTRLDRLRTLLGGDARLDDGVTNAPADAAAIATGDAFRPSGWGNLSVVFVGEREDRKIGTVRYRQMEFEIISRARVKANLEAAHEQAEGLIANCITILNDSRSDSGNWHDLNFGEVRHVVEAESAGPLAIRYHKATLPVIVSVKVT